MEPEEDRAAGLAALAAEWGERLRLAAAEELSGEAAGFLELREAYEVVHKPMLAVRSQPSTEGLIVARLAGRRGGAFGVAQVVTLESGSRVETFGALGPWRRVFCRCTRSAKQDAPLPDTPVPAWVMEEHPALGRLLRRLQ